MSETPPINEAQTRPIGQPESNTSLNKLRDSVDSTLGAKIEGVSQSIEATLLEYMLRPSSDPKIIDAMYDLVNNIGTSLSLGNEIEVLPQPVVLDVKAGLVGAARVFDPAGDSHSPIATPEDVGLARRFLELAQRRVGRIDDTTSEADIRMRLSPEQSSPVIRHIKKPSRA